MRSSNVARIVACLAVAAGAVISASAQEAALIGVETRGGSPVPSRVVERVDDAQLTRLNGGTHPMARAEFDRGLVNPQLPMDRIILVLKRSPAQEAALEKFMARQLDPKSPDFHHWLEPKEFGALYGPSDSDIRSITSWLQNHGFRIDNVSNGRVFLEFSGTAAQVQEAFHTEIHRYAVSGVQHIANKVDPSIPAALKPVVEGIFSLNDFRSKPMHRDYGSMRRDQKTGKWTPVNEDAVAKPLYNVPGSGTPSFELVSPYDFAAIYNVLPLWNAGIDGTGQTIAIAGRSDISLADVAKFRSSFGLPVKAPTIIVNGPDPGIPTAGDKVENTLDVEWSGAVAKNATIKYVTTKSTNTSDGASASAMYIIDNKVAPVMSFSYGNCELAYGTAGNAANNSLWQQAAAQGITAFVASGDQGAAACDGGQSAPYGSNFGLAVSGASTTPYNVAVGGTDLNWGNSTKSYWNSTNATNGSSAKGYILEVPWNGTCASNAVDKLFGFTAAGYDNEQACEYMIENNFDISLVNVVGGTGGKSACTTPSSNTVASCSGGYAKPSWQTGTGVPADGKRDVPDVSLFASGGSLYTAYAICDSQTTPCTYTDTNDAYAQAVGGTSVSSPAMAGIMALVNQKMGSAQGNANVAFYALAAKDNRASCNTNTVAAGNTCNFYDITTDNIAVPCIPGSPNCTVHHSGDQVGILTGYTSTTGYDLATGLGTVNATNLVNNWATVAGGTKTVTVSPTTLTFASTVIGVTTAAQVVTIKNTGTAAVTLTSETITGTNASSFVKSATTCTTSLAAAASCTVSVTFKPTVAGALTASLSVADNATGSPQLVTLKGTGANSTLTVSATPASLAFAATSQGATSAAQVVTVKNTGTAAVTLTTNGITFTGTNATSFVKTATTCGTSLAVSASCTISVAFKPATTGALTAKLSVADNAAGSPQLVSLSGTGTTPTAPTVTLTPTSIAFPATITGTTSDAQIVTLKNTSTLSVTISSITLGGTNASSFIDLSTCGTTLAASASCSIYVAFKPGSAAALTGTLSVADNATGSPQKVTLTGTGTAAPTVTLSAASVAFATTKVGTTTAAKTVTVTNSGKATLNLTSIALGGTNPTSFIELDNCGATLAPAASCTVYLAFKPAAVGALKATVTITDNASPTTQTIVLTGTGN